MSTRGKDGQTLRAHLEITASGIFPDLDAKAHLENAPELPTSCANVWAMFLQLHSRREVNENGPVRFSWQELKAWLSTTGSIITGWELYLILSLEETFFAVRAENK